MLNKKEIKELVECVEQNIDAINSIKIGKVPYSIFADNKGYFLKCMYNHNVDMNNPDKIKGLFDLDPDKLETYVAIHKFNKQYVVSELYSKGLLRKIKGKATNQQIIDSVKEILDSQKRKL